MLSVRELTVRYGDTVALDEVSLDVADGTIVCVLGPSGSGKSTLLRTIAGLEPPVAGRIAWDGTDLGPLPPHRRGLGLMFQDHALFPHRDVLGNVAFGLRMQRLDAAATEACARVMLQLVGLAGYEHRRVGELSGGEQQRVALARALAPEPRLLMLDEPLGSLDRVLRERLVADLRGVFARTGTTALFVTHDHDEAFALADSLVVMRAGHVEQQGAPDEVWHRPANEFVARFLGFTNVLGGATAHALGGHDGRIALRPDGLSITPDGAIGAVVTDRTFRRDHFVVRVVTDDGTPLDVAVRDTDLPPVDARVRIAADPTRIAPLPPG